MKDDALCLAHVEVQCLGKVPRNGFPLAVLITREPYGLCGLGQLAELGDYILFVVTDHVLGGEVFGDVDSDSAFR